MFKVAPSAAGNSEPPPLPPTTVVADFKRRRKETEAERFAFGTFGYYCTMLLGVWLNWCPPKVVKVSDQQSVRIDTNLLTQNILLPGWLRRLRRATRETSQSSMIWWRSCLSTMSRGRLTGTSSEPKCLYFLIAFSVPEYIQKECAPHSIQKAIFSTWEI